MSRHFDDGLYQVISTMYRVTLCLSVIWNVLVTTGKLVVVPEDRMSAPGGLVRLNCSTNDEHSEMTPVNWYHRPIGSSEVNHVFDGKSVDSRVLGNKYEVVIERSTGRYDLILKNVDVSDSGMYLCTEGSWIGIGGATAEVIIVVDPEQGLHSNDIFLDHCNAIVQLIFEIYSQLRILSEREPTMFVFSVVACIILYELHRRFLMIKFDLDDDCHNESSTTIHTKTGEKSSSQAAMQDLRDLLERLKHRQDRLLQHLNQHSSIIEDRSEDLVSVEKDLHYELLMINLKRGQIRVYQNEFSWPRLSEIEDTSKSTRTKFPKPPDQHSQIIQRLLSELIQIKREHVEALEEQESSSPEELKRITKLNLFRLKQLKKLCSSLRLEFGFRQSAVTSPGDKIQVPQTPRKRTKKVAWMSNEIAFVINASVGILLAIIASVFFSSKNFSLLANMILGCCLPLILLLLLLKFVSRLDLTSYGEQILLALN